MFECFDVLDLDANAVDSVSPSDAHSSLQLHTGYIWPRFKLFFRLSFLMQSVHGSCFHRARATILALLSLLDLDQPLTGRDSP